MLKTQDFTRSFLKESSRRLCEGYEKKNYEYSLLAIMTGGSTGAKEAFFCLRKLKERGYNVTLLATPSCVKIHGYETICIQSNADKLICDDNVLLVSNLLKKHSQVVIPILTSNSASKIATGCWDTLATYLVYQALLEGKRVIVAKDSAYPKQDDKTSVSLELKNRNAIIKLIEKNLNTIFELGINVVNLSELLSFYPEITGKDEFIKGDTIYKDIASKRDKYTINKKVITKDDIFPFKDETNKIIINKNSIVTHLAKEFSSSLGIEIEKC